MTTIERKMGITELTLSLNDLFPLDSNKLAADDKYYEPKFSQEQIEAIKLMSNAIWYIARTAGIKSDVHSEAERLSNAILDFAWFLEEDVNNRTEEE